MRTYASQHLDVTMNTRKSKIVNKQKVTNQKYILCRTFPFSSAYRLDAVGTGNVALPNSSSPLCFHLYSSDGKISSEPTTCIAENHNRSTGCLFQRQHPSHKWCGTPGTGLPQATGRCSYRRCSYCKNSRQLEPASFVPIINDYPLSILNTVSRTNNPVHTWRHTPRYFLKGVDMALEFRNDQFLAPAARGGKVRSAFKTLDVENLGFS